MMSDRSFKTFLYWTALAILPTSLMAQGKPAALPPGFDAFVAQVMDLDLRAVPDTSSSRP